MIIVIGFLTVCHFNLFPSLSCAKTLDNWDSILRISVLGCDEEQYDYLPELKCEHPMPLGWLGAWLLFAIVIFGAYVLPTVLIGIVAISFDDATTKQKMIEGMENEMHRVVDRAKKNLPTFITSNRINLVRDLFELMDADGEMTLDFNGK